MAVPSNADRAGHDRRMLTLVKLVHTAVWIGFNVCFAIGIWAGLSGRFDAWFWIPVALIGAECLVILFNRWTCPLTPIAARYTDARDDAFDIYLPQWLARHNKTIYSALLLIAAVLIAVVNLR